MIRRRMSRVAAGHAANILQEASEYGKPATILKTVDQTELDVYSKLSGAYKDDPVHEFIPSFQGVVEDMNGEGTVSKFIRIGNLLHDFCQPKVMDVKLGVRTFLESECGNAKPRPDLFERMVKLYPLELTAEELMAQTITKHRWMLARDANSTIASLGHRIDGIAGYRTMQRKDVDDELASLRSPDDTCRVFEKFAEVSATDDGQELCSVRPVVIAIQMREQLSKMRTAFELSSFVKRHEFIGTSLLFVADASGRAGVFWIDFAKTHSLVDGMEITHCEPWVPGNHEDGIMIGLDNLIRAFDKVVERLSQGAGGVSSMNVEVSFPLCLHEDSTSVARPSLAQRIGHRLPPLGRAQKGSIKQAETSIVMSDVCLLSFLPSLSGNIADTQGRIWAAGSNVVVVAALGAAAAGAAAKGVAKTGAMAAEAVATGAVEAGTAVAGVAAVGGNKAVGAARTGVAAAGAAATGAAEAGATVVGAAATGAATTRTAAVEAAKTGVTTAGTVASGTFTAGAVVVGIAAAGAGGLCEKTRALVPTDTRNQLRSDTPTCGMSSLAQCKPIWRQAPTAVSHA